MKVLSKFLIVFSVLALAACSSDNNRPRAIDVDFSTLQVFHGVSDAPTVNVIIDGSTVLSGVDFLQSSNFISVEAGAHTVQVDAILPDGSTVTVIPETAVTLSADTIYLVSAIGTVATIEASIITQPDTPVPADSARVFVLHGTPGPVGPDFSLPVDVHVTTPGGALDMPLTFDYRGTIGPVDLVAGDYQIRVFLAGSTEEADLVYDSGTITLAAGSDLRLVAVPNTFGGPGALTLAGLTPSGPIEILDTRTPTGLRLGHLSPDTPDVDIWANGAVYAGPVGYPTVTGFAPLPAGTYTVAVAAPTGTENFAIGPVDLPFDAGTLNSVLVVDFLANITDPMGMYLPIVLADRPRPLATAAQVNVIHASPTAQTVDDVDVYVVPVVPEVETDITNTDPTVPGFAFRDVTDYVQFAGGDYDVIVTLAGSKDPVIGPARVTLEAGGIYTVIARDPGAEEMGFQLTVLEDFLNEND